MQFQNGKLISDMDKETKSIERRVLMENLAVVREMLERDGSTPELANREHALVVRIKRLDREMLE